MQVAQPRGKLVHLLVIGGGFRPGDLGGKRRRLLFRGGDGVFRFPDQLLFFRLFGAVCPRAVRRLLLLRARLRLFRPVRLLFRLPHGALLRRIFFIGTGEYGQPPSRKLEDLPRDALYKVAVVRNEEQGAVEGFERLFEAFARLQVEVVGRLVQKQKVCPLRFQQHQREFCTLPAGECGHALFHVFFGQLRAGEHGARLRLRQVGVLVPQRAEHRFRGVEVGVFLVVVSDLVEPAELHARSRAQQGAHQRRFPRSVFADDGDLLAPAHLEGDVFGERLLPCGKAQVFRGERAFLAALRRFEGKFRRTGRRKGLFEQFHAFQFFHARLRALCRRRAHDVAGNVVFEGGDLLLLPLVFFEGAFVLFRLQNFVFGIISAERIYLFVFQLENFAREAVEEVTVVRNGEDGAAVGFQVVLQPEEGGGVEVVGRLVQQQQFGLFQQQAAQFEAGLFPAAHGGDDLLRPVCKAHAREHGAYLHVGIVSVRGGDALFALLVAGGKRLVFLPAELYLREACGQLSLFFHRPEHGGEHAAHLFIYGLAALQPARLFEQTDLQPALFQHPARVGGKPAREQAHEGGLALAVGADQPDAVAFGDREANVFEDILFVVAEAYVFKRH